MVSTVTTTTVTTAAAVGLSEALGAAAMSALIILLIQCELASAAGPRLRPLARNLTVVIAALLIVFIAIVASRLVALPSVGLHH